MNILAFVMTAGITLPVAGDVQLWDMTVEPPAHIADMPEGTPWGACLTEAGDPLEGCLEYYTGQTGDQGPFTVTGRLAFNDRAPDLAYRGLQLSDATGMDDCGERDNCDVLYIAGFADVALASRAMELARSGAVVTVTGQGVWNLESVDLIVEGIE